MTTTNNEYRLIPDQEVLFLPFGDQAKRVEILQEQLRIEMPILLQSQVCNGLTKFFKSISETLQENNLVVPHYITIDFYNESDDEGGTTPHIGDVSLYGEDSEYIYSEGYDDIIVNVKSRYSDGIYEYSFREAVRDAIYNCVNVSELYEYMDYLHFFKIGGETDVK